MPRTVQTNLFPKLPERIDDGTQLVALDRSAAARRGLPSRRLTDLARETLAKSGLAIASAAEARHTLKRVIAVNFPNADSASLAKRILNVLQIVLRTNIDAEKLIEHGSSRVRQLGQIAIAYRRALRDQKLIDSIELFSVAARCEPEPQRLLIYGYHRARKEEIEFIHAVSGDGSIYYLPCGNDGIFTVNREWAEYLRMNGWTIADDGKLPVTAGELLAACFVDHAAEPPTVDAVAYSNVEAEIRGALAAAKQLVSDGVKPSEIAIIARDQDLYAPAVAAVADEYGLPVSIGHTVSLGSTSFGGFVRLLVESVDSAFAFESTMRLVMHTLGPKLATGKLADARKFHISGHAKWAELCPELAGLEWPERQTLSAWSTAMRAAFAAVGVRRKAAMRASELIAHNRFLEVLAAAEQLEGERPLPFENFAGIVNEILADESVPLRPSKVGVLLAAPKNIIGSSFEHVFVLGMAEGVFPQPASEDPVVDFYERRVLAPCGVSFAEAAEVARWEELSFYFTLLTARGTVRFSYPKIIENGEAVKSSFFQRLGLEKVPDAADLAVSSSIEEQRRAYLRHDIAVADPVIAAAREQHRIECLRESSEAFDEYDGVIGVPYDPASRTWSASQLTAIGQCSFRWFAERLLRLKPLDEMAIGLDPATRGLLFHKTLEIAVTRAKDAADIRAATLEHLEQAFAEAEKDEDVGLPRLPNWQLERVEQLRDLRKAVMAPEFIFDGSKVVGIEQKFENVWQGFPLIGYIDRVDDTQAGLIAIDYKTSGTVPKGAKDRSGKLSVDVQIPLYANVALPQLYPDGNLGNSVYYSLTKGEILREVKPDDMQKLDELAEDLRALLAAGSFAVDPDRAEGACTYCQYESVCRKGPRLRRKSR